MKNVALLKDFFVLTPGDLTAQEFPPPGDLTSKAKKMLMPGAQPGGGGGLGTDGID